MRIVKLNGKGDELLLETEVVEQAEALLRDLQKQGAWTGTESGEDALEVLERRPAILPDVIYVMYPMAGGL